MSREQRAELELLRKSNEVQLLELECLRADCSLHQGTINHYEAEVERLRKENGILGKMASDLDTRLHRIEEAARKVDSWSRINGMFREVPGAPFEVLRAALEEEA